MKPINTYKRFFRYLRKARVEREITFVVLRSNLPIKSDKGRKVNAHSVWSPVYFSGGMTGYLSPFQVLHRTFFQGESAKEWLGTHSAAMAMGMPQEKFQELLDACVEDRKHLLSLRRRLMKACGLVEVPNIKRPRYDDYGSNITAVGEDDVPF